MATNQSMLEQILSAALSGGGLRGAVPDGTGGAGGAGGNLGNILGGLLGGLSGGNALPGGPAGQAGGGGLGDLLGGILSAATGAAGGAGGAIQGGQGLPGTPPQPGAPSQPGVPQGKNMGDLVRYGGIAVIGALAYQALKRYQAQQAGEKPKTGAAALVPPPDSGFDPQDQEGGPEAASGALLNAMIAAAQADGMIDADELHRLTGQLDKLGISSADRQALVAQLKRPVNPADVVNSASSPEMALQIYAASALAVTIDTPEERRYLDKLAEDIGVDPALKQQVEQTVGRA